MSDQILRNQEFPIIFTYKTDRNQEFFNQISKEIVIFDENFFDFQSTIKQIDQFNSEFNAFAEKLHFS